jgi:UDP-N-acetylglucosamine--N-acetylmuramyl-(pentapeptide) pyrophosphoryl-undecaprenol N-acetylglucosamine transferase
MNGKAPLLVLAAGGTGGHMFPAQALAEEMLSRGWRVKLTTDDRGARYTGGFPEAVEISIIDAGTFARGGLRAKLTVPFKIASGALSAMFSMRRDRPAVVAGFGGYPALPTMIGAILAGAPRIIHEQNGVLGRVNQLLAKRVEMIACGMWPTVLPDGAAGRHVGNPVRSAIVERTAANYISPGEWPMSILVLGGSQGSSIVSTTAAQAMAHIPPEKRQYLRVACQTRVEDADEVTQIFAEAGVLAEVEPFFDDVPTRIAESQLVVARAGASTVADISVIGRPSILIPLAIATRDHQTANARSLVDKGAAILLPEAEVTPEVLAKCIERVLDSPEGAGQMADAATELGKPYAAVELADIVEQIAADNAA